jgi:hypothetical protein
MPDQLDDIRQQTTLVRRWRMVNGELVYVGMAPRPLDPDDDRDALDQLHHEPDDDQPR